jgi:hypothetical protein
VGGGEVTGKPRRTAVARSLWSETGGNSREFCARIALHVKEFRGVNSRAWIDLVDAAAGEDPRGNETSLCSKRSRACFCPTVSEGSVPAKVYVFRASSEHIHQVSDVRCGRPGFESGKQG